jgi:acyl-coenzyme A synthetase/AMP-(fatty) acid ligase
MIESGNYNCYEFYLAATEKYGDYKQAQHMDGMVMRSQFICDIEALAVYFSKELGLKRGDVYSIFVPSDIESFTAFYALNKLGVIV